MANAVLRDNEVQLLLLDLMTEQTDTALGLSKRLNRLSQGAVHLSWTAVLANLQAMRQNELVVANTIRQRCVYVLTAGGDHRLQQAGQQLQNLHTQLATQARTRDELIQQALKQTLQQQLQDFGQDDALNRCVDNLTGELLPGALKRAATGATAASIAQQTIAAAGDVRAVAALLLNRAPVRAAAEQSGQTDATAPALVDASGELARAHTQNELTHSLIGVRTILIESSGADVRVFPTNSNELRLREHFTHYLDEYAGSLVQEGEVLHVLPGARPTNSAGDAPMWGSALVTLGIPARFKGDVQIHNQAGNVGVLNLRSLDSLGITTDGGNVELIYLAARQLAVASTRGDVTLRGSNLHVAQLDLTSGSPLVEQSVFGRLQLRCGEGEARLRKLNVEGGIVINGGHVTARLQDLRAAHIQVQLTTGYLAASQLHAPTVTASLKQGDIMYQQAAEAAQYTLTASDAIATPANFTTTVTNGDHQKSGHLGTKPQAAITLSAEDGSVHLEAE